VAMLELFHRIAEPDSAQVRKLVLDVGLDGQVQFRNVAFPEAAAAFHSHGGTQTPALWDGKRLYQGQRDVTARLRRRREGG
jgi:hypothetical protein